MKLLAFCLLLGMSAQGQTPKIDTNVFVNTFISCAEGITISIATRTGKNDVIAKCHDGYYKRVVADETDGPLGDGPNPPWSPAELGPDGKILWIDPKVDPRKPWDEVDAQDWWPRKSSVPAEPVDVPAVQETLPEGQWYVFPASKSNCGKMSGHWIEGWDYCSVPSYHETCADKSRVLLTSEDGKKHCIKFETIEKSGKE